MSLLFRWEIDVHGQYRCMCCHDPVCPNDASVDSPQAFCAEHEAEAMADRQCDRCGHQFETVDQRREHEQQGDRGERTLCPCGDVCYEDEDTIDPR